MSSRRSDFEARWRELASRARGAAPAESPRSLESLARLARARAPQAVPFLDRRTTWGLAAVAALLTAYFAPIAFSSDEALPTLVAAKPPNLPPPPSLPPPPALEAPAYYLAKAGAALKELP